MRALHCRVALGATALAALSFGAGVASAQLPLVSDLPVVRDLPAAPSTPAVPPIPGVSAPQAPDVPRAVDDTVAAPSGSGASSSSTPAGSGGGSGASDRGSTPSTPAARRSARAALARRVAAARGAEAAPADAPRAATPKPAPDGGNRVTRAAREIVEVIPTPVKLLIGALALAALGFAIRSTITARRARRLDRQRAQLLDDIGLLQGMLLPDVPARIGSLELSVAYRPAEGPAAGGDFYDVFELDDHRVALMVGDVCGHGPEALGATSLTRYSLRAYLNAGLEPRRALQVAARPLESDPAGALTTVVLAVYDSRAGTLTYACAGHEPPIVLGGAAHRPVTACAAPPLGGFMDTGQRQTTISLGPGSSACFFTDGLVEARLGDSLIGRDRLEAMLAELDTEGGAQLLLDRLASAADRAPDDMAACLVRTAADATAGAPERIEELELGSSENENARVAGFLEACGLPAERAADELERVHAARSEFGAVLLRVLVSPDSHRVDVLPVEATPRVPLPPVPSTSRVSAA